MADNNGAWQDYPGSEPNAVWFRSHPRRTKPATILSGAVIKQYTLLETDAAGKSIPHLGAGAPISGIAAYDIDASGGDVEVQVFSEASFWEEAIVWVVDELVDTITLPDGTSLLVTAYDSGASTDILKQKLVEGSKFENLGFSTLGELNNG